MNIPAEFNEIRPYTPEELPQIYEELIADPAFRTVVESVMPGVPFEGLAMKMRQCKTNLEFQKAFFYGLLWDLVKKTANGLTFDCSALSDLTRNYYSGLGFSIYPTDRQRNDNRRDRHRRQPAHLPMDS